MEVVVMLFMLSFFLVMIDDILGIKLLFRRVLMLSILGLGLGIFLKNWLPFFHEITFIKIVLLTCFITFVYVWKELLSLFRGFFESKEIKILRSVIKDLDQHYGGEKTINEFTITIKPELEIKVDMLGELEILKILNDRKWSVREFVYSEIISICEDLIINNDSYGDSRKKSFKEIYFEIVGQLEELGTITKDFSEELKQGIEIKRIVKKLSNS